MTPASEGLRGLAAMVLAAGFGTRLRPLTEELPKPLVPVGDRSVLAHVCDTLAAAGPPRQESAEGIKATHPVFVDVDPFSMQVQAVPSLFALGPLRGDNFARFAIHDGWGVAHAIRTQAAQVEGSQQLCEREATAAAAVAAVQDLK